MVQLAVKMTGDVRRRAVREKDGRRAGPVTLSTASGADNLGLITVCGTVIAPRPFQPWRAPAERRR